MRVHLAQGVWIPEPRVALGSICIRAEIVRKPSNPRRGIERMELTVDEVGCVDRRSGSMVGRTPIHAPPVVRLMLPSVTWSTLFLMKLTVKTIT